MILNDWPEWERPRHAYDSNGIIRMALETFGLDEDFVFDGLGIPQFARSPSRLDFDQLGSVEWFVICNMLHLFPDCITYGYTYREHKARVASALENGLFHIPLNRDVQRVLRDVRTDWWRNYWGIGRHYGFRLRWKIRYLDFTTLIRRLCARPSAVGLTSMSRAQFVEGEFLTRNFGLSGLRTQVRREVSEGATTLSASIVSDTKDYT